MTADWGVSYVQQQLLANKLVARLSLAKAAASKVVVRAWEEPTQGVWENAYQEQTGNALPILPGVRLLWLNLKRGHIEAYTTAYDLSNGAVSSGLVYPYIDGNAAKDAFRLMGVLLGAAAHGGYPSGDIGYFYNPTEGALINVNASRFNHMLNGLNQMMIIYKLRSTLAAAGSPKLHLAVQLGTNLRWGDTSVSPDYLESMTLLCKFNTQTLSEAVVTPADLITSQKYGTPLINSLMANSNTQAGLYTTGLALINNPLPRFENGEMRENLAGLSEFTLGTAFGNTVTATGAIELHQGMFIRNDRNGLDKQMPALVAEQTPFSGSSTWETGSKAWLYGLFTNPDDEPTEY